MQSKGNPLLLPTGELGGLVVLAIGEADPFQRPTRADMPIPRPRIDQWEFDIA